MTQKFKNLDVYGRRFAELVNKINEDLNTKTNDELIILMQEAKATTSGNCAWYNFRVSRTVLEEVSNILKIREREESSNA